MIERNRFALSVAHWRTAALAALVWGLGCVSTSCAEQSGPGGDSSTHFWRSCETNEQCGSEYECICGRCSEPCNRASDCSDDAAACVGAAQALSCALAGNVCAPTPSQSDASSTGEGQTAPDGAAVSAASMLDSGVDSVPAPSAEPSVSSSADEDSGMPTISSDAATASDAAPTAGPTWTSVSSVESTAGLAFAPAVTQDALGNVLTVWITRTPDGVAESFSVDASHYGVAEGWQQPVTLTTSASFLGRLCVAGNPSGSAVAAWTADTDERSQLWAAVYTSSEGWAEATAVGPQQGTANVLDCAMDAQSNALLAWTQHDGAKYVLSASRHAAGGAWTEPERLDDTELNAFEVSLAIDGAGNALVLWDAWLGDVEELWSNRYVAEVGWQAAVAMPSTPGLNVHNADVALNASGAGLGVWSEQTTDGSQHQAWAIEMSTDGTWGQPQQLASGAEALSSLAVGLADSGTAIAVWEALTPVESETTQQNSILTRARQGGAWSPARVLATDAAHVSLAVNSAGQALAAWRTPLDYMLDGDIAVASFSEEAGFGLATTLVEAAAGDSVAARVSIDETGRACVVWQQTTQSQRGDILSAQLR